MTVTKDHIVNSLCNELGLPKRRSAEMLESLLSLIAKTLESGEDVLISGFGKFCVTHKAGRKGRNPQTGTAMTLRPRRIVTFKCSGRLRDKINEAR